MAPNRHPPMLRTVWREFADMQVTRSGEVARHQHHDYEFLRVRRGTYRCDLNEVSLTLRPGDALLIKPGDVHYDRFDEVPLRYQGVRFDVETRDLGRPYPVFRADVDVDAQRLRAPSRVFDTLLRNLGAEVRDADGFSAHLRTVLTEELFWFVVRLLPPEALRSELVPDAPESERFLSSLRALFASARHRHDLDVDAMAEGMHMSRRNLTRKCRMWLGVPPARAFLHYRVSLASELLRQTGMTCQEVAAYFGFANPYHFSKAFKRVFAVSPQDYRDGKTARGEQGIVWLE